MGRAFGQGALAGALAQAAAEFLATGKMDAAVIQKLAASGQVPATLMMKVLAAKNDPEKLKEIAKGLAGTQIDGPAPGLSFVKPEVTPGRAAAAGDFFVSRFGADAARTAGDGAAGTRGAGAGARRFRRRWRRMRSGRGWGISLKAAASC